MMVKMICRKTGCCECTQPVPVLPLGQHPMAGVGGQEPQSQLGQCGCVWFLPRGSTCFEGPLGLKVPKG